MGFLNAGLDVIDKSESSSIETTVGKLNDGSLTCAENFCVAFSASERIYFVLFKPGHEMAAVDRLATTEIISTPAAPAQVCAAEEDTSKSGEGMSKVPTPPVAPSNVRAEHVSKVLLASDWARRAGKLGKAGAAEYWEGAAALPFSEAAKATNA